MDRGGEKQHQTEDDIRELIDDGLDEEQIAQAARNYAALLQQRLSESADTGVAIERTLIDFQHALRNRQRSRERVLQAGVVIVDGPGPVVSGVIELHDHGRRLAPAFQFNEHREPLQALLELNVELGSDADPWAAAAWWVTPLRQLQDRSPIEALSTDGPEVVRAVIQDPAYSY